MTAKLLMKIECFGDHREISGFGIGNENDLCQHEAILAKLVGAFAIGVQKIMDDPKDYHALVNSFAAASIMATANGVPIPEIMNDLYRAMSDSLKEFEKVEQQQSQSPGDLFEEMLASFAKRNDKKEG